MLVSLKYMNMMVGRVEMSEKVGIGNVRGREGEGMIKLRTGGRVQIGL